MSAPVPPRPPRMSKPPPPPEATPPVKGAPDLTVDSPPPPPDDEPPPPPDVEEAPPPLPPLPAKKRVSMMIDGPVPGLGGQPVKARTVSPLANSSSVGAPAVGSPPTHSGASSPKAGSPTPLAKPRRLSVPPPPPVIDESREGGGADDGPPPPPDEIGGPEDGTSGEEGGALSKSGSSARMGGGAGLDDFGGRVSGGGSSGAVDDLDGPPPPPEDEGSDTDLPPLPPDDPDDEPSGAPRKGSLSPPPAASAKPTVKRSLSPPTSNPSSRSNSMTNTRAAPPNIDAAPAGKTSGSSSGGGGGGSGGTPGTAAASSGSASGAAVAKRAPPVDMGFAGKKTGTTPTTTGTTGTTSSPAPAAASPKPSVGATAGASSGSSAPRKATPQTDELVRKVATPTATSPSVGATSPPAVKTGTRTLSPPAVVPAKAAGATAPSKTAATATSPTAAKGGAPASSPAGAPRGGSSGGGAPSAASAAAAAAAAAEPDPEPPVLDDDDDVPPPPDLDEDGIPPPPVVEDEGRKGSGLPEDGDDDGAVDIPPPDDDFLGDAPPPPDDFFDDAPPPPDDDGEETAGAVSSPRGGGASGDGGRNSSGDASGRASGRARRGSESGDGSSSSGGKMKKSPSRAALHMKRNTTNVPSFETKLDEHLSLIVDPSSGPIADDTPERCQRRADIEDVWIQKRTAQGKRLFQKPHALRGKCVWRLTKAHLPPPPPPPHSPLLSGFDDEDTPETIVLSSENEQRPTVRAGTLNKLVERLAYDKYPDPSYTLAFLLTYRMFTTPDMLLDMLIARYCMLPPRSVTTVPQEREWREKILLLVRLRVFNVVKTWLSQFFDDFRNDSALRTKLETFCDTTLMYTGMDKPVATLKRLIKSQMEGKANSDGKILRHECPETLIPANYRDSDIDFNSVPAEEFARQMTLLEHHLLKSINLSEFLNQGWAKKTEDETAPQASPNVRRMIQHFNRMSLLAATIIVNSESPEHRKKSVIKFIQIIEHCQKLNNFNGMMEIVAGLQMTCIYRLTDLWNSLPQKYQNMFEEHKTVLSRASNYKNLRTMLKSTTSAGIPYLGMYLTDLTFIQDGSQDMIGENRDLINFQKQRQVAQVVLLIQQFQERMYELTPIEGLKDWIMKYSIFTEEACYKCSLMIQPKSKTVRTESVNLPPTSLLDYPSTP